MDTRRAYPRYAIASLMGNLALLASWGVLLTRPNGWLIVGVLLLIAFFALRVGGMWLYATAQGEESRQRTRRAAIFTTVLAFVIVGLWVATALRGPRLSF